MIKEISTNKPYDLKACYEKLNDNAIGRLERKLSKLLGVNIKITKEYIDADDRLFSRKYASIKLYCDENLVNHCGIIALGIKSAKLQDFGVHVYKTIEYDENDTSESPKYKCLGYRLHVTFDIRYTLKCGGSNGISVLNADYNFKTNKWSFQTIE